MNNIYDVIIHNYTNMYLYAYVYIHICKCIHLHIYVHMYMCIYILHIHTMDLLLESRNSSIDLYVNNLALIALILIILVL